MRNISKYFVATGLLLLTCLTILFFALVTRPAGTALASAVSHTSVAPENCGPGWAAVPSIDVPASNNILSGVSVLSASEVWAVGAFAPTAGLTQTLTSAGIARSGISSPASTSAPATTSWRRFRPALQTMSGLWAFTVQHPRQPTRPSYSTGTVPPGHNLQAPAPGARKTTCMAWPGCRPQMPGLWAITATPPTYFSRLQRGGTVRSGALSPALIQL